MFDCVIKYDNIFKNLCLSEFFFLSLNNEDEVTDSDTYIKCKRS